MPNFRKLSPNIKRFFNPTSNGILLKCAQRNRFLFFGDQYIFFLAIKLKTSLFSGELSESTACIMFSKPIERMMIRYDRQPSDFSNILEPAFDSLNDKNGPRFSRRIVNIFGGVVHERPSSGTYLTLSRYAWKYLTLYFSVISVVFLSFPLLVEKLFFQFI